MKFKFSLRSFLIFFTALVAIGCFRAKERSSLRMAAKKIIDLGGVVYFSWQNPSVAKIPVQVPNAYFQVPVIYQEWLADGNTTTKTRMENAHRNVGYTVLAEYIRPFVMKSPKFNTISFLSGSHSDVDITAVSMPASSINDASIRLLTRIPRLKSVLVLSKQDYYSVKHSTRVTDEQRNKDLKQFSEDRQNAIRLLEANLPAVVVYKDGVLP